MSTTRPIPSARQHARAHRVRFASKRKPRMALAAAKAAVRSLPRRLRSQANTRSVGRRAAQAVMNITKMHFFLAFSEAPHTWAAAAFRGRPARTSSETPPTVQNLRRGRPVGSPSIRRRMRKQGEAMPRLYGSGPSHERSEMRDGLPRIARRRAIRATRAGAW